MKSVLLELMDFEREVVLLRIKILFVVQVLPGIVLKLLPQILIDQCFLLQGRLQILDDIRLEVLRKL